MPAEDKEIVRYRDLIAATGAIVWILKDQGAPTMDYRLKMVDGFAWIVAPISKKYGVDIDATVVAIYCESSFHIDAIGALGERGLMQHNNTKLKNWLDAHENVEKGVKLLRRAIVECRKEYGDATTWEQVFGHYRSGVCNPKYGERKAKLFRRMKRDLRHGRHATL